MSDGIYSKHEMLEGVIERLDALTITGAKNVVLLCDALQMLYALQKGLKNEDKAKETTIEILKEQLKRATTPEVEPGGDVVGGQHIDLKFGGADNGTD